MRSNSLAQLLVARRAKFALAGVVAVALLAAGLGGLRLNASYSAYFDPDEAQSPRAVDSRATFADADSVVVVLDMCEGCALQPTSIDLLRDLTGAVKALPNVTAVRSVLDFTRAAGDAAADAAAETELAELLGEDAVAQTSFDPTTVAGDPRVRGTLVSSDERALLFEVVYALPEAGNAGLVQDTLARLRATVDARISAAAGPDIKVHYSGALALNEAYVRTVRHDLRVFIPGLVLSMLVVLLVLFRNVPAVLAMLAVATGAVLAAFGLAGWLQLELAAINAFAPVMIASLAIAGSVHVTNRYAAARLEGPATSAAEASLSANLLPLVLTSATTVAGFLALLISPSPPVRAMGVVVAAGITVATLLNITLLPALLVRIRGDIRAPQLGIGQLAAFAARHGTSLRLPLVLACLVALAGAASNRINDNVFEYFAPGHEFRSATTVVHELFSGINRLSYVVDSGDDYGLFEVQTLGLVEGFRQWALAQPEVSNAVALTAVPRVSRVLEHHDANARLAHYGELARAQSPAALGIGQWVDDAFSATPVRVYLHAIDARALIDFDRRAAEWLTRHAGDLRIGNGTGPSLLFAHLGQRNAHGMLQALAASVVVLTLVCGWVTRSVRGAMTGLFLNVFPLAAVYAVWAVLDGHISIGGTIVIGMILGIIVDDTVYLLTHYRRALQQGLPQPAIAAVTAVGPALLITSLTLCVGLAVGLLSDFAPIVTMSTLSIAVIAVALLADLFALPGFIGDPRPSAISRTNTNDVATARR